MASTAEELGMTATAVRTNTTATTTRRSRRVATRLGLVLAAAAVLVSATACDARVQQVIDWTNQTRTSVGRAPLENNMQLWMKAGAWAIKMHDAGKISHSTLTDGISYNWRSLGENVGSGPDLREIYDALLRSPGHYANIVDGRFQYIGVGVYYDGSTYWVSQVFMGV